MMTGANGHYGPNVVASHDYKNVKDIVHYWIHQMQNVMAIT